MLRAVSTRTSSGKRDGERQTIQVKGAVKKEGEFALGKLMRHQELLHAEEMTMAGEQDPEIRE